MTPSNQSTNARLSLMALLISIVILILLKPERLTNALQEISETQTTQQVTQMWDSIATQSGLLRFSQWQQQIIIASSSAARLGSIGYEADSATLKTQSTTVGLAVPQRTPEREPSQPKGKPKQAKTIFSEYSLTPEYILYALPGAKNTTTFTPIPSLWHTTEAPRIEHLWFRSLFPIDSPTLSAANLYDYPFPPLLPVEYPVILLVGDSMMMEGLGPALLRTLQKRNDVIVHREAVYSTGLCRRDYFDWPKHLATLVTKYNPRIIVVSLGGNDAQDIVDERKKRHLVGTKSWEEQYKLRAEELAQVAQSKGAAIVWVGLPIIGRAKQAKHAVQLTEQQKAAMQTGTNRYFVDTYATLTNEDGAYTTFLQDEKGTLIRIRAKDQVHVTEAGGRLLAQDVLPVIENLLSETAITPEISPSIATTPNATEQ